MRDFVLLLTMLPGAWAGYGIVRVILSFTGLSFDDQIELSFLTGMACLLAVTALAFAGQLDRK